MTAKTRDQIIDCPMTGGKFNYVTEIAPGILNYMSLSSGFWTNSLMTKGSQFYNEQVVKLPELYQALEWEDPNTKYVWFPQTINIETVGMVFANGPSKFDWGWSAVKAIPVSEEEKEKYPNPKKKGTFYKHRMDMANILNFNKDEFMNALSYLGIFNN